MFKYTKRLGENWNQSRKGKKEKMHNTSKILDRIEIQSIVIQKVFYCNSTINYNHS